MLESKVREAVLAARDDAAARGVVASIAVHRERSHLMRIGNNSVSLNTSEVLTRLDVEVTDGRRQGSHTHLGSINGPEVVSAALATAIEKARVAVEKDYQPLKDVVEEGIDECDQYDSALAQLDPAVKADAYARVISEVGGQYNYSGSWSSGVAELYLVTTANSNEAWHSGTDQKFTIVLKHPDQKWELSHNQTGWRSSDFSAAQTIGRLRALLPTYLSHKGHRVEPGHYTVLFGPRAIAGVVGMATWSGLSGRSWEEKMGWTAGQQLGDRIVGDNITIVDDPEHPDTFKMAFDITGKRRRRFPLVEQGRLKQLMYDASTAAKYGRPATGHSTGSASLTVWPGDGPPDPLAAVADLGSVLYIPDLHYMHLPNRSQGIFTGSSRFNAVLVEHGEIAGPIFSTRITDSFRNVLEHATVISSETRSVNTSNTYGRRQPTAMSVPTYMLVEGVNVTDCADSY